MATARPNIVYKYHKINQYLFDLIDTNCLWFSHQNELNDPYDCKYALSDQVLLQLLNTSSMSVLEDLQKTNPTFCGISQESFFENMLPRLKSDEWMNGLYNLMYGKMLGWSVCSFTAKPMNELMWAHYAEMHKGVCLKFNLSLTPELNEKLNQVRYTNNFPVINSMEDLPNALLTKRNAWSYEDEWRILTNVRGAKPFIKASLEAIYFGCYADKEKIEDIRVLTVKNGYKDLDFKQLSFHVKGVKLKPIHEKSI